VLKAPPKPATFEQRWSVWGAGYGGSNRTSGDPAVVGSHDLLRAHAGGTAGSTTISRATAWWASHSPAAAAIGALAQGLGGGKSDAFQAHLRRDAMGPGPISPRSLSFTNH